MTPTDDTTNWDDPFGTHTAPGSHAPGAAGSGEIDPDDDDVLPDWADDDGAESRRWELSKDSRFRLDQFLKNHIGHMSRHQLKKVIDLDGVTVNGKKPKASKRLKAGDVIEVMLPPRPAKYIKPQDIPLSIVHEDEDMVVVNKQAGLTVHPAKAQLDGTLVNALAYHFLKQQHGQGFTEAEAQAIALERFENRPQTHPAAVDNDPEHTRNQTHNPKKNPQNPPNGPRANRPKPAPRKQEADKVQTDRAGTVAEQTMADNVGLPARNPRNVSGKSQGLGQGVGQGQRPADQADLNASTGELAALGEDTDFSVEGLSSVGVDDARPGIVHRLDKFTTGIIIIAKRDETHWLLSRQFEHRTNLKCYLALVHGNLPQEETVINEPLTRHHTIREAQAVRRDSQARDALTICRVRERYKGYDLVELELKTGRTHQIRVHMQYIGHPLVGDIVYGGEPMGQRELDSPPEACGSRPFYSFARDKAGGRDLYDRAIARPDMILARPALHATLLRIKHPVSGQDHTFTAPLHEPFLGLVHELRKRPLGNHPRLTVPGTHIDLDLAVPEASGLGPLPE